MRLLKLLLVLIVCAAAPAVADPYTDGQVAYRKGDYVMAFRLWRPLADQGNAEAQVRVGSMYDLGQGVPQNYAAAAAWYRNAADQGNASGQLYLGGSYFLGHGVPQSFVQAHKWLNLAASRFDASEKNDRDLAVKMRDQVAAKMTPAQIAEAQKLAREWKPTPAR